MICPDEEALSAYSDDEVASQESRALRAHLDCCDKCRLRLRAIEAAKASLAGLPAEDMPADLEESLLAMSRSAPERSSTWERFLGEVWAGAANPTAVVTAALAACLALLIWGQGQMRV